MTSKQERNFRNEKFVLLSTFIIASKYSTSQKQFQQLPNLKERNFGPRKNLIIVNDVTVLLSPVSLPVQFCTPLEVKVLIRTRKENGYGIFLIVFISENHDVSKEKSDVYT